jgi:hypothetical protein
VTPGFADTGREIEEVAKVGLARDRGALGRLVLLEGGGTARDVTLCDGRDSNDNEARFCRVEGAGRVFVGLGCRCCSACSRVP